MTKMEEREAWMDRTTVTSTIVFILRANPNRTKHKMFILSKHRNIVEMEGNKIKEAKVFSNHILSLIITLQLITRILLAPWDQIALRELTLITSQVQAQKVQPKQ